MSDTDKHIRLGNGLTAEFLQGTVILVRAHKDPKRIPGDLTETFIAHESVDGRFEMIDTQDAAATCLVHQEVDGRPYEFKAYTGEMIGLSQRRVVKKFLDLISLERGTIERFKNGHAPHVKQVGKTDLSIKTEGDAECQR